MDGTFSDGFVAGLIAGMILAGFTCMIAVVLNEDEDE
jgi:hypothetical protein